MINYAAFRKELNQLMATIIKIDDRMKTAAVDDLTEAQYLLCCNLGAIFNYANECAAECTDKINKGVIE